MVLHRLHYDGPKTPDSVFPYDEDVTKENPLYVETSGPGGTFFRSVKLREVVPLGYLRLPDLPGVDKTGGRQTEEGRVIGVHIHSFGRVDEIGSVTDVGVSSGTRVGWGS